MFPVFWPDESHFLTHEKFIGDLMTPFLKLLSFEELESKTVSAVTVVKWSSG